ncbi:MAG: DUF1080 domain-containing protein [Limisphaerales bacterium]
MKLRLLPVLVVLLASAAHAADSPPNLLTADEQAAGWRLLFDGSSFSGWRGYRQAGMPALGWRVKDGQIEKIGGERGGDIVTAGTFGDFEFTWEWRLGPAGNNGVKYFVTEGRPGAPGHEYQMIDDAGHADAKAGAQRTTAAFYDVLAPAPDKPVKAAGEWNQSRLVVRGGQVEHWLNGVAVLKYELGSDAVKAALARSKFKDQPRFGEKIRGHLMLTDHADACWFRNLKVRELGPH